MTNEKAPVLGSLEFKELLIKRCFAKMAIGALIFAPIYVFKTSILQSQQGSGVGLAALVLMLVAAVFFVLASSDYARSKGLHPAFGLLGIFNIFGLIALAVWPDKYPYSKEAQKLRKKAGR